MRHYETIYIVKPDFAEKDYQEIVEKFGNFIQQQKGVIIKTQEWGTQRLAYDIRKFGKGFYVFVEYCADAGVITQLERAFTLDDRILKSQTVKLADNVDPEELLQKEKEANTPTDEIEESAEEQVGEEEKNEKDSEE